MNTQFQSFDLRALENPRAHGLLLAAIAPRPIAFASTLDEDGNPNLAPFSYFNVFSTHPPIVIFSPNRSGRTGAHKDTYNNAKATGEVVINIVNHALVQQTNVASTEYAKGVNEFTKAGLTALPSELVKPPRVAESPVQLECTVRQIVELGDNPGAGNLIICEVVRMHVNQDVLDATGRIDTHKLDLVARMGANYYCRANHEALFELPKPPGQSIGVDALPESARRSRTLTGNDLGMLATSTHLPTNEELEHFKERHMGMLEHLNGPDQVHLKVQALLNEGRTLEALCLVMLKG